MHLRPYTLLFVFLSLFSCSDDDPLPAYSEWIVVGNDRGLRNEFIDQGNVVTLTDSAFTVYSVLYREHVGTYPFTDSTVMRTPEDGWKVSTDSAGSLVLSDSLKRNNYHLRPLVGNGITDLSERLQRSVLVNEYYNTTCDLILELADQDTTRNARARNCYATRCRRQRDGDTFAIIEEDGYWLLNEDFRQPILVYSSGETNYNLLVIDSLQNQLLSGLGLSTNSSSGRGYQDSIALREETHPDWLASFPDLLPRLVTEKAEVTVFNDSESVNGELAALRQSRDQKAPALELDEIPTVRLELTADAYVLRAGERPIRTGNYQLHDRFPYLVLDGGCENTAYLRIDSLTERGLTISLPIPVMRNIDMADLSKRLGRKIPDVYAAVDEELRLFIPVE